MATGSIVAGGGDSRDNNNSSGKKLYAQKIHNKSKNPDHISQLHSDTVASGDSSCYNRLHNSSRNSLHGYVKFDNKVRISLNNGSKSVVSALKRQLVSELDQIRSFKRKLEAKEIQCDDNRVVGGGTLARVNSEVSYVGPTNSQPLQADDDDVNRHGNCSAGENVDKQKKMSKLNQYHEKQVSVVGKEKILNSESKELKSCSGGKKGSGGKVIEFGAGMDRCNKNMFKCCGKLLGDLMKHQYGWVFNAPVDVKKLKLHDYYKIIKHPMDLGTVKSRLQKNWYKSPKKFAEDVRLTFNNAMTYNEKGQDAHFMADVLLKLFEGKWTAVKVKLNYDVDNDASLSKPTKKRASAPALTSEARILDGSESMMKPIDSNLMATDVTRHEEGQLKSNKPMGKDPQKREMTFEEKQRLSTDLLNLPSEKLDSVVQIIKKRNPGLFQQEDEIEVDIDGFDTETLWELDRLVTNYKKSLNQNMRKYEPTLQTRQATGNNFQETNQTSIAAEFPEESEAVKKIVPASYLDQGEEQGDNASGSSCSSSSSSDFGSSPSDSDSDGASGYGSDAGQ